MFTLYYCATAVCVVLLLRCRSKPKVMVVAHRESSNYSIGTIGHWIDTPVILAFLRFTPVILEFSKTFPKTNCSGCCFLCVVGPVIECAMSISHIPAGQVTAFWRFQLILLASSNKFLHIVLNSLFLHLCFAVAHCLRRVLCVFRLQYDRVTYQEWIGIYHVSDLATGISTHAHTTPKEIVNVLSSEPMPFLALYAVAFSLCVPMLGVHEA